MQENDFPAWTVIMNDQIVHTDNFRVLHDNLLDILYQLFAGRRAQKRIQRFFCSAYSGKKDHQRNQNPAIAVYRQCRKARSKCSSQNNARGNAVAQAVYAGCPQRCRIKTLADTELYKNI